MDERKDQPLGLDEFSTEKEQEEGDVNNLIPQSGVIAKSLSLIFCNWDTTIRNTSQTRFNKHQESYNTKMLDILLVVALQQTFGIGLSYNFDYFDPRQKGRIPRYTSCKRTCQRALHGTRRSWTTPNKKELGVLYRLEENVITAANQEESDEEMMLAERKRRTSQKRGRPNEGFNTRFDSDSC